jgi:acyl-CoA thioester hydrolase
MSRRSTSRLRVRYAETDQMGLAWHGNYLAWFEVGRTDLLRETGLTYRELEQQGLRLPVIAAEARYLRPARYDDQLEVETELDHMAGARVRFIYRVRRSGEDQPLAMGATEHAVVDGSGRPRRMPEDLRRRLS